MGLHVPVHDALRVAEVQSLQSADSQQCDCTVGVRVLHWRHACKRRAEATETDHARVMAPKRHVHWSGWSFLGAHGKHQL